jgi:hypothetical protein
MEDAEPLLRLLADDPRALVDWRGCEHAHAAVIQILLAAGRRMVGPPANAVLKHVEPLLSGAYVDRHPR